MLDYFEVKVLEIQPMAIYHGVNYTQNVKVQLSNGKKINFFDGACKINNSLKGRKIKISSYILASEPPTNSEKKEKNILPIGDNHVNIAGKIIELKLIREGSEKWLSGVIDAGGAKFKFSCKEDLSLKKGDFVRYVSEKEGYRIDIADVKQ